jgi:hypothetical protein
MNIEDKFLLYIDYLRIFKKSKPTKNALKSNGSPKAHNNNLVQKKPWGGHLFGGSGRTGWTGRTGGTVGRCKMGLIGRMGQIEKNLETGWTVGQLDRSDWGKIKMNRRNNDRFTCN